MSAILLLLSLAILGGCTANKSRAERAAQLERAGDYPGALALYQELLRRQAWGPLESSQLHLHAGICLWRMERGGDALEEFENAASADPMNTVAHLRLGEIYVAARKPDLALEQVRYVLTRDPANAEGLAILGAIYQSQGMIAEAVQALAKSHQADPAGVNVAVALAELYLQGNETEEARAILREAAEAQPASPVPWMALGRLEEQTGNSGAAEAGYRRAVAAADVPETNLRLALFLQRASRIDEADAVLSKVDKQRPAQPTSLADAEFFSGRALSAIQNYMEVLRKHQGALAKLNAGDGKIDPVRAAVAARVVEADLESASWLERLRDSKTVIFRGSPSSLARAHLDQHRKEMDAATIATLEAEIALADNDLARAELRARDAVKQSGESAAAHYILGNALYRRGQMNASKAEWLQALDLDADYTPVRLALAEQSLRASEPGTAEELVVPVVRAEPANFHALLLYGRVLLAQKRYDDARSLAQRAVAVNSSSAEPQLILGQASLAQHDYGTALLHFEQGVLVEPQSASAIRGLAEVYRHGTVTRTMLQHIEKIAIAPPRSATLMEVVGRLYADGGFYDDATRCLHKALDWDGGRISAAIALSKTYASHGEMDRAAGVAKRFAGAKAAAAQDSSTLFAGVQAHNHNDIEAAIRDYETAVRHGDKTGVAANNLAWIYAQRGTQLDRALELASTARDLAPDDPAVLDTLGFVRLERREYSDAIANLKAAETLARRRGKIAPPVLLAQIRRHLADAYRLAGEPEAAAAAASRKANQ